MPLLDQAAREQVRELFAQLEAPITLAFYTRPTSKLALPGHLAGEVCPSCDDEEQLLRELVELTDKLDLQVSDVQAEPSQAQAAGIERVPALELKGPAAGGRVRFFGLPSGYEFSTLIADIADLSTGATQLSEAARQELAGLESPVHLQVFVTPT
jgi:alkyl hydroperoxide reductase subunit AhpF